MDNPHTGEGTTSKRENSADADRIRGNDNEDDIDISSSRSSPSLARMPLDQGEGAGSLARTQRKTTFVRTVQQQSKLNFRRQLRSRKNYPPRRGERPVLDLQVPSPHVPEAQGLLSGESPVQSAD